MRLNSVRYLQYATLNFLLTSSPSQQMHPLHLILEEDRRGAANVRKYLNKRPHKGEGRDDPQALEPVVQLLVVIIYRCTTGHAYSKGEAAHDANDWPHSPWRGACRRTH